MNKVCSICIFNCLSLFCVNRWRCSEYQLNLAAINKHYLFAILWIHNHNHNHISLSYIPGCYWEYCDQISRFTVTVRAKLLYEICPSSKCTSIEVIAISIILNSHTAYIQPLNKSINCMIWSVCVCVMRSQAAHMNQDICCS